MGRAAEVFAAIRRRPDFSPTTNKGAASGSAPPSDPIRLSGTNPQTLSSYEANPKDGELGDTNGREGNDYPMPGGVRGRFDVGQISGGPRRQDTARTYLSDGPSVGRIPRGWNDRNIGILGRDITGNPSGDDAFAMVTSSQAGGIGDGKFVPHTPTPRNIGIARTYLRTVDDAAQIPGIFLSDPTRH